MGRDITVWQGHFLADADGSYHHVARSLADVIVAAIECEESWAFGRAPSWEHPTLPFTVVAGMAKRIPGAAVDDEPQGDVSAPIMRLDDGTGSSTWWIDYSGEIRAFFTREDAMAWRNDVFIFGVANADKGTFATLTKEGY
ncbi:hypothetical protein ADL19_14910 [Streptomyces purpurogeneiscleroticus]|nr:hypothetical protein ADL19_14910 [Streptomyces purpurogeneiscleroticus]